MAIVTVRPARAEDAPAMAAVHVRSWQETYRGLMSDAVLDDPGNLARRERMWSAVLSAPASAGTRVAVAECAGELVGIAMSEPSPEAERRLSVLYLLAAQHGSGAGVALLDAVLDPHCSATLLVADPNPRAQAFYRRHGFHAVGPAKPGGFGVAELRMLRPASTGQAARR